MADGERTEGRRVGILGGSFNPPHRGHVAMCRAVRDALALDTVLLIPAARPPHKPDDPELVPPWDRWAMTRLAAEWAGLEASDIELYRSGPSYTLDTIRALRAERGGDRLYFIIGADTVPELPSWKEARRLLGEASFVVVARPGFDLERGLGVVEREIGPEPAAGLRQRIVPMEPVDVSSTGVRAAIGRGERGWQDLVPPPVAEYIRAHGLYGGTP